VVGEIDDKTAVLVEKVKISKVRFMIMKTFLDREIIMPKQISDIIGVRLTYVGVCLKKLSDIGLVVCLNPNHRANRKFILTKKGREIIQYLE